MQIIGRHFHLEHHDTGVNLTANRSGLRSTYEHNGPNAKAMDWTGVRAASTDERHWSSQRHKKALHFRSTRLASHNSATADSSGRLLHFTWDGRVRINGRCHGNHLAHFPPYGLSFFNFLFLFEIFAATEMSKKQQPEAQQRHSSTLRLNNIPRADDNEAETQPTSAGL